MMTEQQIALAKLLIATGVVDRVYHSVKLHADEAHSNKYPVYAKGAEEFYIGPDDKKNRFAYIRQTGPVTKGEERLESSEQKMYFLLAPNRIVVFKDREKENVDRLIRKLLATCFTENISLVSYQHDAFKLAKQETPIGNFSFDATTFYLAIDVQIRWWIDAKDCEEESCIVYPNPICK